jgi:hypothetical protein
MNHCLIINVVINEASPRNAGAYRIATILRDLGWDTEVLDFTNVWSLSELKQFAKSRITSDTKFIGFSQLCSQWSSIMESWCEWIKTIWPDIYLIAGAPAAPTYESKYLDYYVSGYGEEALKVLLKYLFSNGPRPIFDLTISTKKKIINADKTYPAYPCPELLIEYEERDFIRPEEWIAIETTRGCIFKCDFCSFPILGVKEDYTRAQKDFEIQIKGAHDNWGITKFNVVDSTFNDKIDKVSKYADVVESLNFKPLFGGYVRADLLVTRPRDREELLRMNFLNHYYGIETFNLPSSKSIHKGFHPDKMKEGLKGIRDYFVRRVGEEYVGCVGLIIGLQFETKESIESTMSWLENNWSDQAHSFAPFILWRKEFTNNTSAMSLNPAKYGYSEMSTEEAIARAKETNIKIDFEADPSMAYFPESGVTPISEVVWKNEFMDVFDAHRMWLDYHDRLWWRDNHFSAGKKVIAELVVDGMPFLEWYKIKKLGF